MKQNTFKLSMIASLVAGLTLAGAASADTIDPHQYLNGGESQTLVEVGVVHLNRAQPTVSGVAGSVIAVQSTAAGAGSFLTGLTQGQTTSILVGAPAGAVGVLAAAAVTGPSALTGGTTDSSPDTAISFGARRGWVNDDLNLTSGMKASVILPMGQARPIVQAQGFVENVDFTNPWAPAYGMGAGIAHGVGGQNSPVVSAHLLIPIMQPKHNESVPILKIEATKYMKSIDQIDSTISAGAVWRF